MDLLEPQLFINILIRRTIKKPESDYQIFGVSCYVDLSFIYKRCSCRDDTNEQRTYKQTESEKMDLVSNLQNSITKNECQRILLRWNSNY